MKFLAAHLTKIVYILTVVLLLIIGTTAKAQTVTPPHVVQHIERMEAITLIEDMIEWTEFDIQEGKIAEETGYLLIQNLQELKAKLN